MKRKPSGPLNHWSARTWEVPEDIVRFDAAEHVKDAENRARRLALRSSRVPVDFAPGYVYKEGDEKLWMDQGSDLSSPLPTVQPVRVNCEHPSRHNMGGGRRPGLRIGPLETAPIYQARLKNRFRRRRSVLRVWLDRLPSTGVHMKAAEA